MKFIALFPFFCGFVLSRELCPNVKIEYIGVVNMFPTEEVIYNILPKDNITQSIVQENNDLLFYLHELTDVRAINIENKNNKSLKCTFSLENIFEYAYLNGSETTAFIENITCNNEQLIVSKALYMQSNLNRFMNAFGCNINSPKEEFNNMLILLIYHNDHQLRVKYKQKYCEIHPLRFGYLVGLNLNERDGSEEQKMINFQTKVTNCRIKEPTNDSNFVYILLGVFLFCLAFIVLTKIWLKV